MEACVVFCRMNKPTERAGKVLFINAVNEFRREEAQSFLAAANITRILDAYRRGINEDGFARVITMSEILAADASLGLTLHIPAPAAATRSAEPMPLSVCIDQWLASSVRARRAGDAVLRVLGHPSRG